MIPISDYHQFLQKYEALKGASRLFMFILFDSRPSHRAMERFIAANFGWLDNLAASQKMFGFAFLQTGDDGAIQSNPSLRVASHFDIQPNELPGILAFTMLADAQGVSSAVYLPLKAELFSETSDVVEAVFADVFTVFGEALSEANSEEALIEILQEKFNAIRRREQRRPVMAFLGEQARALAKLPSRLLEVTAASFGEALADGLMGR